MYIAALLALLSSGLYFYTSYILWNRFNSNYKSHQVWARKRFLLYISIATGLHFLSFAGSLIQNGMIMFGLGVSLSLIAWIAVCTLLITNLKQPTENLGIFILPIAGISVLFTFIFPATEGISADIGSHVLLSLTAYSILGLAAAQAFLYSIQEKRFQQKKLTTIFKNLPPLQVMESIMVQLITIGFILLTLSLITGIIFIEDMFAQHLVHKTFFGIIAWITYATFLIGHYKKGWRGQTATRFTFWAYFMLILSYIGTEIILTQIR